MGLRPEAPAYLVNPTSNVSPSVLTKVQQTQSSEAADALQNVRLASGNTLSAGYVDPIPLVKVADFIEVIDVSEPSKRCFRTLVVNAFVRHDCRMQPNN